MKSKLLPKKFTLSSPFEKHNAAITHSSKPLEFDPSQLRLPKTVSLKRQSNIKTSARDLYELLIRTGLKFRDEELDGTFDLTIESDATAMLLTERRDSSWETQPQVDATVQIIADVARRAAHFRTTFCFAAVRTPTFEQVLLAMDEVAAAVGPIADCHRFAMDVEMAASGLRERLGPRYADLFSVDGQCDRVVLQDQAKRLTAIRSTNPFDLLRFIQTSNAHSIACAVRRADLFEFSVGKIDVKNSDLMNRLAEHLEVQRKVAAEAH